MARNFPGVMGRDVFLSRRELSDCQTGEHPGQLCGDLGWVAAWQLGPVVRRRTFLEQLLDEEP